MASHLATQCMGPAIIEDTQETDPEVLLGPAHIVCANATGPGVLVRALGLLESAQFSEIYLHPPLLGCLSLLLATSDQGVGTIPDGDTAK